MLELELNKTDDAGAVSGVTATLENVNLRTEKSGPDKIPAIDMKLSCAQNADVLANFSPTLKNFLFEVSVDLAGDVMAVRDSHLGYPLSRDEEMSGAKVSIGYGPGAPMLFDDCKVNAFKLTPMEGGTVILGFRVQCRASPEQVARLYELLERGIELTIEPAELPEMKAA